MIRRYLRRAIAAVCRRRGHPYPTRDVDGVMGGHPVRLTICSHCEVILSGDILPPRRLRRQASRTGVDVIGLVGPDGRPVRKS